MTPRPTRSIPEGSKQTHEWLAVSELFVDHQYQRPQNNRKIAQIMRDFDPDLVGTLIVSLRDDGLYAVIDGQQRREAVLRMWGDAQRLPCEVFHGLTLEREAHLFVEYNRTRTKPRPTEIFKGNLAAKDEQAMAIARILSRYGLAVGGTASPRNVHCIGTIQSIYNKAGAEVLSEALDLIVRSGMVQEEPLQGVFLDGLSLLLARYPRLERARLKHVLQEAIPRRIIASARQAKIDVAARNATLGVVVARLLLQQYNRGRRSKRIEWVEDVTDNFFWKPVTQPTE